MSGFIPKVTHLRLFLDHSRSLKSQYGLEKVHRMTQILFTLTAQVVLRAFSPPRKHPGNARGNILGKVGIRSKNDLEFSQLSSLGAPGVRPVVEISNVENMNMDVSLH